MTSLKRVLITLSEICSMIFNPAEEGSNSGEFKWFKAVAHRKKVKATQCFHVNVEDKNREQLRHSFVAGASKSDRLDLTYRAEMNQLLLIFLVSLKFSNKL